MNKYINSSWTSLSSGSYRKLRPLKNDLAPDAKSVRCHLIKYSQDQRQWLA